MTDAPTLKTTLQRFGAIAVRMYADGHAQPHFHIEAPDFEVLVRLSNFAVIAGDARPGQIAEVLEWAAEQRGALARKWSELNERG